MNNIDQTRKRVCNFIEKNQHCGNKTILQHFLKEGIPRSTIYRLIKRVKNGIGAERKKGQGRVAIKMTSANRDKIKRFFDHKTGRSQRAAARKFNINQSYVCKLLKDLSITCRKKQTIPDRSEQQAKDAKTKCGILLRKYKNREWILDDESYFTLSNTSIAGNDVYYTSDVSATPSDVKFSAKKKFEKKLLVWLAISRKGISDIFFLPSGLAINQEIYGEECIRQRLIPCIQKFHSDDEIIFWPDLASSHYAESVCDILIEEKIDFVEKYENPANLPECRPIEQLWAILKTAVYAQSWKAKDLSQLRRRVVDCVNKLDQSIVAKLFDSMLKNMRSVSRQGVIEKQ